MTVRTIAIIGGLVTDLVTLADRIPDRGETITSAHFSTHHGGKGANSAVAAYRLTHANPKGSGHTQATENEIQVYMTGAVGADEFGPPLKEKLTANGVNTHGIRVVKGQPTGVGVVLVEADFGENRILFHPGANHDLLPSDFMTLESLASGVKPDLVISQLELRRDTIEQVIETAYREGIDVLLNPAPASYLMPNIYRMVTHLIVNETEAAMLSPSDIDHQDGWTQVAGYFLRLGVKNVVVTLGALGAYYSNESSSGYVEAEKQCDVLDTTGAGDTFVGAFAAQYIQQKDMQVWDIKLAVEYACKASARTIEHIGCLDPIPWADQVNIPGAPLEADKSKQEN